MGFLPQLTAYFPTKKPQKSNIFRNLKRKQILKRILGEKILV